MPYQLGNNVASIEIMEDIINIKMEKAYFKAVFCHLPEGTEESHEKLILDGQSG